MSSIINQSPIGATYCNQCIGYYTVLCHSGNQTVIRVDSTNQILPVHFEDVGTEFISEYFFNGPDCSHTIHGVASLVLWDIWENMVGSCYNEYHPLYYMNGGLGRSMDDRWLTFANFLADMQRNPGAYASLMNSADRFDNQQDVQAINQYYATH